jgi:hypothetical protein
MALRRVREFEILHNVISVRIRGAALHYGSKIYILQHAKYHIKTMVHLRNVVTQFVNEPFIGARNDLRFIE